MDKVSSALSGKKGLIIYITAGFPDYQKCEETVLEAANNGADVIEIGLPFSDPLADGPILQKASCEALGAGANTKNTLAMIKSLREKTKVPLMIMSYINPIFAYGLEKFAKEAKDAGLDGLILPDVPEEESALVDSLLNEHGLINIHFIAPTSGEKRIEDICNKADKGFVYCIARTGVTGTAGGFDGESKNLVQTARKNTKLPLAMGFGITTVEAAKEAVAIADAAIVGSAAVEKLGKYGPKAVGEFVKSLRLGIDGK